MGYQQKSYKKFVATAATATLVASAIVPVASAAGFSDVSENSEFAPFINALTEEGIINGYASDNTFRPNNKLTRGQVAIMLGRWLENNGETVPADWNTVSRFEDVPANATSAAGQELAKYAALVKDSGVFTGVLGNLNPTQNITRENMAVVLDRVTSVVAGVSLVELAEEIEDVTVNDLGVAQTAYQDEIQALADLGITTVSNFRPKEQVSRAQFAKFLYTTFEIIEEVTAPLTAKELTAEVASIVGTLPAVNTITADNATTAKATAGAATTALAAIEAVIADGKYTEEEVTELNKVVAAAKTAIAEVNAKADEVIEAAKVLAVDSVTAINAGELQVKFTRPIDSAIATKDDASPTGYYLAANDILKLDGTALAATQPVSLSKDGKTLTIRATTSQNFVGGHTLAVEPSKVKDADSNAHLAGGSFEFTLSADTTRPTLTGVSYKDAKTVVVEFSEPIKSQTAVTSFEYADGTAVTADGVTQTALVPGSKTIEFVLDPTKLTAGKDIKVTFADATDFNGNVISPVTTTFKFVEDATKPVASTITAVANNEFTVKLSKDISTVDVTKIKVNNVALTATIAGAAPSAAGEASYSIDNTNDTVTIKLFDVQTGVVPIVVEAEAFVDALGNKSEAVASQLVNFKPETVAPTLVSSEVKSINNKQHLLLTFNENVTAKTLTAAVATFTYDDANGVTKTIENDNTLVTSLYQPSNGKSKTIAVDLSTVKNGVNTLNTNSSAKVTFAPGFVSDVFGNESVTIKDVAFSTSHTGNTAPRLEVTSITQDTNNAGAVLVAFNERLDIESARNVNNYKINGQTPKEAVITQNDSTGVIVKLVAQDNSIAVTGNYDVTVSGVKASASTVQDQLTKTSAVAITENVRPTVSSVEVVALGATSQLKVTFSEAVKETTQNGDYELFVNGTKVVAATTGAAVAGTKEVTFLVANDLTTTLAQPTSTVELRSTLTNDLTDAVGNKVDANVIKIK